VTFTNDLTTPVGKVRLNIPDTSAADAVFSDEEIQAFLDQEMGNVFFAAADACDVLATNQVYIQKVQTVNGTSTNGAAVSAELRARARTLREQGEKKNGSSTVSTGVAIVRAHRMIRGY